MAYKQFTMYMYMCIYISAYVKRIYACILDTQLVLYCNIHELNRNVKIIYIMSTIIFM